MSRTLSTAEFLKALYGVNTTHHVNRVTDNIDIAVTQILRDNPQRTSFTVVNNSANAVRILTDESVSDTNGIFIAANGGSIVIDWQVDFNLVTHAWYAVAGANNSVVTIIENEIIS